MTDQSEDWETETVETGRPVGAVISVRFPRDLADHIFEEAERRGVPMSALVREAVETYLSHDWGVPASLDITVSGADGPVAFYSGRSRTGRSVGAPSNLELVEA